MNPNPRWLSLVTGAALLLAPACSDSEARVQAAAKSADQSRASAKSTTAKAAVETTGKVVDESLEDYRSELLDLAFSAASAFPLDPHVKNRSRAQEAVAAACFELGQPRRALRYVEQIENWRRGAGYADFARYCAERGDASEVEHYLELASQIADASRDEGSGQAWRRDRIRAKIAGACFLLGREDEAARFAADLVPSESGRIDVLTAAHIGPDEFDRHVEVLDGLIATGTFDQIVNGLDTCVELFDRFFEDAKRRGLVLTKSTSLRAKLPLQVQLDHVLQLTDVSLDHGDRARARALLTMAEPLLASGQWLPEHRVPVLARVAELRFRAGDEDGARRDVAEALATFDAEHGEIVDMFRARALRPVAEAYHVMGDREAALRVYREAVEEGVGNPNSRPRAVDLSATCISMALRGFRPDAELWARLRQVRDELGHPW